MADKSKLIKKTDYRNFLGRLKNEIITARQKAYKTVNRQLVELYLNIGERIYEKVKVSRWGQGVVETLSQDLRKEFPDMKGFSSRNLWEMKKIYETYKDNNKLQPLVAELSWSHNSVIVHQTDSAEEKEFYLRGSVWSTFFRIICKM